MASSISRLAPAEYTAIEMVAPVATDKPIGDEPLMRSDMDQLVQPMIEGLIDALDKDGSILRTVHEVGETLRGHLPI